MQHEQASKLALCLRHSSGVVSCAIVHGSRERRYKQAGKPANNQQCSSKTDTCVKARDIPSQGYTGHVVVSLGKTYDAVSLSLPQRMHVICIDGLLFIHVHDGLLDEGEGAHWVPMSTPQGFRNDVIHHPKLL